MAVTHTVQQGEHISQIMEKYKFLDYRVIWDHASNAELKEKRKSPNVLLPGDEIYIPDRELKSISLETTRKHVLVAPIPTLKLRVVLRDFDNQPMPGVECNLDVDGEVHHL